MDKNYIYQVPIREWIENDWGKGVFVPVYGGKKDDKWDVFFQSYLVSASETEQQLKTDSYDIHGSLFRNYSLWSMGFWRSSIS